MEAFTQLPRGLINSPALLSLYNDAHIDSLSPECDPREYQTVHLLEAIFNKVLFQNHKTVFVNSQVPPHSQSDLKCDLAVKYVTEQSSKPKLLCFVECKRAKKTERYDLKKVERQAREYCDEFFSDRSNLSVQFIYVCTAVGAHMRLWKCSRGDLEGSLDPLWGAAIGASWKDYKDVGKNADGILIQSAFIDMLKFAPERWVGGPDVTTSEKGGAYQLPPLEGL